VLSLTWPLLGLKAGLASVITSVFIASTQGELKPDYEAMSFTVPTIVAAAVQGSPPNGGNSIVPKWNGPDKTAVRVQAILYSSLCASVTVAFVAMLGLQWLTHYAKPERGSSIDPIRNRKLKMDGMDAWRLTSFWIACPSYCTRLSSSSVVAFRTTYSSSTRPLPVS